MIYHSQVKTLRWKANSIQRVERMTQSWEILHLTLRAAGSHQNLGRCLHTAFPPKADATFRLQRTHKSASESGLLLSFLPADRVGIKEAPITQVQLSLLPDCFHISLYIILRLSAALLGSAHRCVIFLYNRLGQFSNIMSSVWNLMATFCYHCKVSMVFKGTITFE